MFRERSTVEPRVQDKLLIDQKSQKKSLEKCQKTFAEDYGYPSNSNSGLYGRQTPRLGSHNLFNNTIDFYPQVGEHDDLEELEPDDYLDLEI